MANSLKAMGVKKYANGFLPTLHKSTLNEPFQWKQPHTVFVCSMADLFHKEVPFSFIDDVFQTIKRTPHHHYQVLTKRAKRMAQYFRTTAVPEKLGWA
jgi:protein gp37